MAEVKDGKGVKLIAFYLPQFHAIPLNDQCWARGLPNGQMYEKHKHYFPGMISPKSHWTLTIMI